MHIYIGPVNLILLSLSLVSTREDASFAIVDRSPLLSPTFKMQLGLGTDWGDVDAENLTKLDDDVCLARIMTLMVLLLFLVMMMIWARE